MESQAHQATLASFQDVRAEVAKLQLTIRELEKQEERSKNMVKSLRAQAAAKEKTWREEVRLLTEQAQNHQTWMESTLSRQEGTQDAASGI